MLILIDKRMPEEAKLELHHFGELLFIESVNITYPAISGHPDIFFCQTKNELVIAPNVQGNIRQQLHHNNIPFAEGELKVGKQYPETVHYNVVVTDGLLIHNPNYTDPLILKNCSGTEIIHVKQAYTRCNLIPLENNRFITSDKGIEKTLLGKGFEILFVHPEGILLPGFDHGFIGGCCGVHKNRLFFIGSLNSFPEGDKIRSFAKGMEIIELYDGPLFDGGSLVFIEGNKT